MRKIYSLLVLLAFTFTSNAQLRSLYNQYMLNQAVFNPGYMDITTRYSATLHFKKQWLTVPETPMTFTANGHYHITQNHGVGAIAISYFAAGVNSL